MIIEMVALAAFGISQPAATPEVNSGPAGTVKAPAAEAPAPRLSATRGTSAEAMAQEPAADAVESAKPAKPVESAAPATPETATGGKTAVPPA